MFDDTKRVAYPLDPMAPIHGATTRGMSQRRRPPDRSLFGMAAWQRMVIGLAALLFLWLFILWATGT